MNTRIILTVLGSDRPGLTQALADAVLASNGNWLESHLSRLGGKYVGSVLVELGEDKVEGLEALVQRIDPDGLQVALVPAGEDPQAGTSSLEVEIVGQDRPGIVREVTSVLARLGANIEEFESEAEMGAWSGEALFRSRIQLTLPPDVTADEVRQALEAISGEIMVDFVFAG